MRTAMKLTFQNKSNSSRVLISPKRKSSKVPRTILKVNPLGEVSGEFGNLRFDEFDLTDLIETAIILETIISVMDTHAKAGGSPGEIFAATEHAFRNYGNG